MSCCFPQSWQGEKFHIHCFFKSKLYSVGEQKCIAIFSLHCEKLSIFEKVANLWWRQRKNFFFSLLSLLCKGLEIVHKDLRICHFSLDKNWFFFILFTCCYKFFQWSCPCKIFVHTLSITLRLIDHLWAHASDFCWKNAFTCCYLSNSMT